eukprot:7391572-Prymnesium_polylepis.2
MCVCVCYGPTGRGTRTGHASGTRSRHGGATRGRHVAKFVLSREIAKQKRRAAACCDARNRQVGAARAVGAAALEHNSRDTVPSLRPFSVVESYASFVLPRGAPRSAQKHISFGQVTEKNVEQLRKLNLSVFPVRYNDKFYTDIATVNATQYTSLGMPAWPAAAERPRAWNPRARVRLLPSA